MPYCSLFWQPLALSATIGSSGHCTSGCVSNALGKNVSHRTNDVLWPTSWLIKLTFEHIYAKISAQLQHQWYGAIISSADRIHLEPQCPFYLISLIMPLDLGWKCRITATYVLVHSYWRYWAVHILSHFAHSVVVMNNLQSCSCYRQQRTSRHHPFVFSFSLDVTLEYFRFTTRRQIKDALTCLHITTVEACQCSSLFGWSAL